MQNGRETLERRGQDSRDAEITRLKKEVEALRERERLARDEAADARAHFSHLTAMSKRFAQSMNAGVRERQQYRHRLAAQYGVSRVLAEARDLQEAAPKVFEILGERLGWQLGVLWTYDRQAGVLRRAGIWRSSDSSPGTMEQACADISLRRGESLPGRVWERAEPVWIEDVLEDGDFLRNEAAEEDGLRGAFAFPIKEGGFVGVFEFFRHDPLPSDEDLLRTGGIIGDQIGQFLERRKAEDALRRNEARWRSLIDKGADVITISDRDGTIRFASPSVEKVSGYTVEEFVGTNPFKAGHIHPDDVERCEEAFRELADTPGHSVAIQHRYRHRSGEWRWLEGTFTSLFHDPTIGGLVANFRDITERKRHEANLAFLSEVSQDLARLTTTQETMDALGAKIGAHFNSSLCIFSVIDEAAGTLTNPYAWHRAGVSSVLGVFSIGDYHTEAFRQASRAGETYVVRDSANDPRMDAKNMATLPIGSFVSVPLVREGEWRFNLTIADTAPRDWRDNEIELMRELANRIWTQLERAHAEEALRESETRFRRVFSNNMEAMAIWTPSGAFTDANDAMLDLIGYSREELEAGSLDWRELTPPEYRDQDERAIAEVEARGVCMPYEKEFVRKDGRRVPILIGGGRFDERAGTGILFAVDLTERERAEEARERLLAHEWTVRAQTEERRRISRELHDRVAHAMGVVHQSLELYEVFKERKPSQAEAKMDLARETTREALRLTRNISRELQDTEAKDGLSAALSNLLKTTVPPGIESNTNVEGDETLIPPRVREQLFLILREAVRNAVSHSDAGRLGIEVKVSTEKVLSRVEDDGRGFEEASGGGGEGVSGRGLQSMRERAELIGGALTVSSTSGAGTRIEVSAPLDTNVAGGRA